MADTQNTSESPSLGLLDEWEGKANKEALDTSLVDKSLNESSIVLDNGVLYGPLKSISKRRLISSLEDSEHIVKEDNREVIYRVNQMLKRNGFDLIKSSSHSAFLKLIEELLQALILRALMIYLKEHSAEVLIRPPHPTPQQPG